MIPDIFGGRVFAMLEWLSYPLDSFKNKIYMSILLPNAVIYLLLILGIGVTGFSAMLNISTLWIGTSLLLFCTFYGYYFIQFKTRFLKLGFGIFTALFATSIGVHIFDPPSWEVISPQLTANTSFSAIYYNFDKLVIAGCIFLFWDGTKGIRWKDSQLLPVFAIGFILISLVGMVTKYITFDPKTIPIHYFAWWAFKNLFLVSLPEEFFFRGFIQREIGRWNPYGGWIIASLLFGFGHMAGGLSYVFLATLAGLMYGWLYLRTHNIFVSISAHFLINTLHIFLFS